MMYGQTLGEQGRATGCGVGGVLRPGFETLGWAYSGGQL